MSPGGVSSGSKAAPKPCPSPTTHASLLPVFPQTLAMRASLEGRSLWPNSTSGSSNGSALL